LHCKYNEREIVYRRREEKKRERRERLKPIPAPVDTIPTIPIGIAVIHPHERSPRRRE
jgi:hypothetical protein